MDSEAESGMPGARARRIGYARVSTEDQNLALQIDALNAAGCDRIYFDSGISGAVVARPALEQALAALSGGDVHIVWKLDRLGRSLAHLIRIVGWLGERSMGFRSLSEAIDTTTAGGRLLFHVMGALAEFERALISERTKAGMAAAKARGARIGRPQKLTAGQIALAQSRLAAGEAEVSGLATCLGVSKATLARALKRRETVAEYPDPWGGPVAPGGRQL